MSGRRDSVTESRILQGRDARCDRVLDPDCRGLEHDMTVVDMGNLPESKVSIPELSELARRWPPAVITHMQWQLEEFKQAARVQYRKKQPAACEFCGTMIRCDMYRHVACCHLEFAQLWRCPVAWCTVWKGAPQDLMDHVRGSHKVSEEVQHIKLETLIPPWTVTRQVYMDSLTLCHSGISNDILLFSDIGLSLTHHYRVHRRGVPHVAFRRNDMSQLRALLSLPAVPLTRGDRRIRIVCQWKILRMSRPTHLDRRDARLHAGA